MAETASLRDKILAVIRDNPGIHFREIQRRTGAAVGQTEYHLYQLERMEKIHIRGDGKMKRYFVVEGTGFMQRKIIYYLRNPISREIMYASLQHGRVPVSSLERGRKSLVEKKRKIIIELTLENVIERFRENGEDYVGIVDSSAVKEILVKFRQSFLDTLTANMLSMLESR